MLEFGSWYLHTKHPLVDSFHWNWVEGVGRILFPCQYIPTQADERPHSSSDLVPKLCQHDEESTISGVAVDCVRIPDMLGRALNTWVVTRIGLYPKLLTCPGARPDRKPSTSASRPRTYSVLPVEGDVQPTEKRPRSWCDIGTGRPQERSPFVAIPRVF